jgi:subtilase family serine protease
MRRSLPIAVAVALAIAMVSSSGLSVLAGSRTALAGSVPAWAKSNKRVGPAASSTKVDFRVYLPWRNANAAAAYALSASTAGSQDFGKFLTPSQFRASYAPTAADVSQLKSWLVRKGFRIGQIPANHHYIEVIGTLGEAAQAFHTTFSIYRYKGQQLRSNDTALSVPSGLPAIEAVIGLDESANLIHYDATPPPVFVNAPPCSSYWGEKTVQNTPTPDSTVLPTDSATVFAPCGYAGAQLQDVYGMSAAITAGNDGSGVTVAVVDAYASPTIFSDVNTYFSLHGLPALTSNNFRQIVAPGTFIRPQNPAQDPQGWSGEETLDIEAVHTMAPGAKIVYVGAPNNYRDLDAAVNHAVDMHVADIMTNSYGFSTEDLPPGYIKSVNDTFIQAAAEGISMLFSSGDNGDETSYYGYANPTPDWPASSPWVTAVGGTSLGIAQDNSRVFELGWETRRQLLDGNTPEAWLDSTWLYGSGGGTSRLFAQPNYQAGTVPTSISETYGGSAMRAVPDVSALGDPTTGMLVGQTQHFPDGSNAYSEYRIGGTSLSSPLMAGMLALALQMRGDDLGLANPALYAAGSSAYYDITTTDVSTYVGAVRSDYINGVDDSSGYRYSTRLFDAESSLTIHVRNGYDDVTGLGSPNGATWLSAVAGY